MTATETTQTPIADAWFKTTHWSSVLHANDGPSSQADAALASLYQTYWYPLYVFARRQGQGPEDAQDLVQGFFARVLAKDYLKSADRDKGKFRSFLLMGLKRFMANEWDRANSQKRGGGQQLLSLDETNTETRFLSEPKDEMTPEKAFERRWAMTLLAQVLTQLKVESYAAGKGELFEELEVFLSGENDGNSYSEAGQNLNLSPEALRMSVFRLRSRFRELLRREIANTVETTEAIDEVFRN